MKHISPLKNVVQEYAWGSYTAIPELMGNPSPSENPQAELWMGAHPKAPSSVHMDNRWLSLEEVIKKDPITILGKSVAEKFNNRLPFLFKVLAAEKPLSIQAHPNRTQAIAGFEKENRLGIPFEASDRNYKDNNHKPECICALTPFWALNGFRSIREIISGIKDCCPKGLEKERRLLERNPTDDGLKRFFKSLMMLNPDKKTKIIEEALSVAEKHREKDAAYDWMIRLHQAYPSDIGIISPIILNLILLLPGQAMFLPSGQLHAYLNGLGMELMANSDNVLRGGLTPKHVDVEELLKVLRFKQSKIAIHSPGPESKLEYLYPSDAEEFVLSVISIKKGDVFESNELSGVEILFCSAGSARIKSVAEKESITLNQGASAVISAAAGKYSIEGDATVYKAAVPITAYSIHSALADNRET